MPKANPKKTRIVDAGDVGRNDWVVKIERIPRLADPDLFTWVVYARGGREPIASGDVFDRASKAIRQWETLRYRMGSMGMVRADRK